jgi:hypothetical protein
MDDAIDILARRFPKPTSTMHRLAARDPDFSLDL